MSRPTPSPAPGPIAGERRRGLTPPAIVGLALFVLALAGVVWLALSGPPETPSETRQTINLIPDPSATAPAAALPAPTAADRPSAPFGAPVPGGPSEAFFGTEPASKEPIADPERTDPERTDSERAEASRTAPSTPVPEPEPLAPTPLAQARPTPPQEAPVPLARHGETPSPSARPDTPSADSSGTETVASLPVPMVAGLPLPEPSLLESTLIGPLPRIAPDGRRPWQAYARPFDVTDPRPRIAIIITGLGLSGAATEAAIQRLPGAMTLSFAPYARDLQHWINLARAAGHEVMIDLPMEPASFPANDPGPQTLLTTLTTEQNMTRLHWVLSRVAGYTGVVNHMGSRFTESETHLLPILEEINQRGLLFVDSRSSLRSVAVPVAASIGLPHAANSRFIDAEASRDNIDRRLEELERLARSSGSVVGIATTFPVTLERLVPWARTLESRGFVLAPVSAVVGR